MTNERQISLWDLAEKSQKLRNILTVFVPIQSNRCQLTDEKTENQRKGNDLPSVMCVARFKAGRRTLVLFLVHSALCCHIYFKWNCPLFCFVCLTYLEVCNAYSSLFFWLLSFPYLVLCFSSQEKFFSKLGILAHPFLHFSFSLNLPSFQPHFQPAERFNVTYNSIFPNPL